MTNFDKLMAAGAENCHPKLIADVDGVRSFVGHFVDGEVHLTDAGRKLLSENDDQVVPTKSRASRGKKPEPTETDTQVDDIDLG